MLQEPIKVYGASAVKLGVSADEEATDRYPYHLHLILTNTSPVPVYNAQVNISPETHVNFLFQPQERLTRVLGDIPPGKKTETEDFILAPDISGELDVEKSFIIETAGEREERTNSVTKHPVVEPPPTAPEISAASCRASSYSAGRRCRAQPGIGSSPRRPGRRRSANLSECTPSNTA